jgi:hypothetical protein
MCHEILSEKDNNKSLQSMNDDWHYEGNRKPAKRFGTAKRVKFQIKSEVKNQKSEAGCLQSAIERPRPEDFLPGIWNLWPGIWYFPD